MMIGEARTIYNQLYTIVNRRNRPDCKVVREDLQSAAECLETDQNDWSGCAFNLANAIKTALNDSVYTDVLVEIARIQRRVLANLIAMQKGKGGEKSAVHLRVVSGDEGPA